jgi:hypothetical protein
MSTHGPGTGLRTLADERRRKAQALEIDEKPGVRASPETVARLVAADAYFKMTGKETIRLNLGEGGAKDYGPGDIELMLAQCAESYERFDSQ